MDVVDIGTIHLEIDVSKTTEFYEKADTFICDCKDCKNYVSKIEIVRQSLNGLDSKLGIDLLKAVGIGMDELMPHDYDDHHLYVVPYYIFGTCAVGGQELKAKSHDRIQHKIDDTVSIEFVESSYEPWLFETERALTMWIEFKTPLVE